MRRLLILSLLLAPGACASLPDSCRMVAPSAQAPLSELECASDGGDKQAMLELGRRYEAGSGVRQDFARAASLYRRAATAIPRRSAIYMPPVRRGGTGQVMFFDNANAEAGLAEAHYRLGLLYLEGRGVRRDRDRGNALIRKAALRGYPPAVSHLQRNPG